MVYKTNGHLMIHEINRQLYQKSYDIRKYKKQLEFNIVKQIFEFISSFKRKNKILRTLKIKDLLNIKTMI